MRLTIDKAKIVLRSLVEGNLIRSTERITGIHRNTACMMAGLAGMFGALTSFSRRT